VTAKPAFRSVISDLSKGLVLKPLVQSYLFDAQFPGIDLHIGADEHSLAHGPDGWFHPSTHPLWPARQLWFYQRHPEAIITEPKEYMGTLSITFGKLTHKFMQLCLSDLGVLVRPTMEEILADAEPGVEDALHRSRGHFDGELSLTVPGYPEDKLQLFEFKTRSPKARVIDDLDLDAFMAKYPDYYAQVQEYMRMSGLRLAIVLFFSMGFPWEMTEIHVPYSRAFAEGVREKYANVLQLVVEDEMPPPCCGPRSKESRACPARTVCPVANE
jgi:hypothetical protein